MKSQKSDSNHPPWNKSALQEDEHSVKILQARGAVSLTLKPDGVKGGRGADSCASSARSFQLVQLVGHLWQAAIFVEVGSVAAQAPGLAGGLKCFPFHRRVS